MSLNAPESLAIRYSYGMKLTLQATHRKEYYLINISLKDGIVFFFR